MRLHLYKRGKIWWVRGSADGVKVRRSTKHTSEALAKRVRDRWERELADPTNYAAHRATVASAAERFMKELRQTAKSQGTVRFYDVKVRHVVRHLGAVRLANLSRARILEVVAKRTGKPPEGEGAAQYSVHRELTALRLIMKSAAAAKQWRGDVSALVPTIATGYVPLTDWVTPEHIWKCIDELVKPHVRRRLADHHDASARGATVAWCIATASDFGLLFGANREDVIPDAVRVRGTKTTSRDRYVPRVPVFEPFLAYALEHGSKEGPLFPPWPNMARDVRAACRRAGVPEFTARTLRRSAATWMVRANVPYEIAAKFLGHGSTTMLQKVYGQLAPADAARIIAERMAAAPAVPPVYPTRARNSESVDAEEAGITRNRSTEGTP